MEKPVIVTLTHSMVRLCLLALCGVCLAGAVWGGLTRIGWGDFSSLIAGLPGIHGPLIICGFVGTFFSLERAVAMKGFWGYLAPVLTVTGAFLLVAGPMTKGGPVMVVTGSLVFFFLCLAVLVKKFSLFSFFICLGSLQWLMGNFMWLAKWPVYNVTLWWMSFVLLATAGQRLDIAEMMHVHVGAKAVLALGLGAVFVGHVLTAMGHLSGSDALMDLRGFSIYDPRVQWGMRVAGLGMTTAAAWFLIYDPARARLRSGGLAGYIAVCMMSAYVWLAFSGLFSYFFAGLVSGQLYDTFVHAFFMGFLMFMIFGHAPVLLPTMLELYLRMRPALWGAPVLLHLSLIMRMVGNTWHVEWLRKWGAMMNAVSLVYLLVVLIVALRQDNRPLPPVEEARAA